MGGIHTAIDPALDSGWLAGLTEEERAKLILLDKQIFAALQGTGAYNVLAGAGERIAVSRIVQPIVGISTAGKPVPFVTSAGKITEINSSDLSSYASQRTNLFPATLPPRFTALNAGVSQSNYGSPKIAIVPLTEAAGAIVATTIVAALAGYTACARLIGIYSPQTDAASDWTISIAGGTLIGPAVYTLQLQAYAVTQFSAGVPNVAGIPMPTCGTIAAAADDNKAMQISAVGLPAVGTTYYAILEYWYET